MTHTRFDGDHQEAKKEQLDQWLPNDSRCCPRFSQSDFSLSRSSSSLFLAASSSSPKTGEGSDSKFLNTFQELFLWLSYTGYEAITISILYYNLYMSPHLIIWISHLCAPRADYFSLFSQITPSSWLASPSQSSVPDETVSAPPEGWGRWAPPASLQENPTKQINPEVVFPTHLLHSTFQMSWLIIIYGSQKTFSHPLQRKPSAWVLSAASAAREKASLMASSPTLYITVSSTNLLARTNFVTCAVPKRNQQETARK